jgi:hypothetical protein
MKGHAGYVRIDMEEVSETYEKPVVLAPPTPIKKLGRPKKVAYV